MKYPGYSDFIMNIIIKTPSGETIRAALLAQELAVEFSIDLKKANNITNINLKRLSDAGLLHRFQKGIYLKSIIQQNSSIDDDSIFIDILTLKGDDVIGYLSGESALFKYNITAQLPKNIEITSNDYRKKLPINSTIVIKKPVILITAENYQYLQLLDMIQFMMKINHDRTTIKDTTLKTISKKKLNALKLIYIAREHFSLKTLLFLIDLLATE